MLIEAHSAKCIGIDAIPVTVEVSVDDGIGIHLVGLADEAVKESLLRTMTALQTNGFRIPGKKIVINLAPADMHKNGSGYDLPIAVAILAATGQCELPRMDGFLIMGELGLDGSIREVSGALPVCQLATQGNLSGCILPEASAMEAVALGTDVEIYAVKTLPDVLRILGGRESCDNLLIWNTDLYAQYYKASANDRPASDEYMDFSDIVGQRDAKRGLEVAAAGGHNAIMIGSPGCGKSSLAKAMAGILPPMTKEESILTSKIYSVAGKGSQRYGLMQQRPFRAPHYSASVAAMVGGGNGGNIMPGEVSLAQNGILFLDEFTQLPRTVAEALRGPLEDRCVTISRLRAKAKFPASFMLVAAANPCPCGYYGEGDRCTCSVGQRQNHLSRLSGPIMDRIDIQLWIRPVAPDKLLNKTQEESSSAVASRIVKAREIQRRRFAEDGIFTNAEMGNRLMEKHCPLSGECKELMHKSMTNMGLSARAYGRVLRMARTIADLDAIASGCDEDIPISPQHLLEAITYRFLDKGGRTL